MLDSHIKFLFIFLVITTITSCYLPEIDKGAMDNLDLYEQLVINIENEKEIIFKNEIKRIDFNHSYKISDFSSDCEDCLTSKTVQEIKVNSDLRGFVLASKGPITIFLKKDSRFYMNNYYHTLIFNRKSIPAIDNSEGRKLMLQKKVANNWYYRIVKTTN